MNETCKSCPRPAVMISPDHTDLCVPCHGIKYRPARKARKIKSSYYPCS